MSMSSIFCNLVKDGRQVLFDVTFPKAKDEPARLCERVVRLAVALDVAGEFLAPVFRVRCDLLARMREVSACVPKITVYKDSNFLPREGDVGRARKGAPILAVTQAAMPKRKTETTLGGRIGGADPLHVAAALFGWKIIHELEN